MQWKKAKENCASPGGGKQSKKISPGGGEKFLGATRLPPSAAGERGGGEGGERELCPEKSNWLKLDFL